MSNARVLFVNHTSVVSGAEQVLINLVGASSRPSAFLFEHGALADRLSRQGVQVIQSRFGEGLGGFKRDRSLVNAVPLGSKLLLGGKLLSLVGELSLAARRHDVIYANSQKAFTLGALAASITRRPLVWHLHDIMNSDHFLESQRRLQVRLANALATAVIGPSRAVAAAFVAEGGRPDLTHVVPNGVPESAETRTREEIRRELGLASGDMIGVFSRLAPWKGQHVMFRALARLPGVHCLVVGSALFGESEYEATLHALAATLGIADRVTFLGQRSDVAQLMRAVDVVVHPSVSAEPFALTILEAMHAGTPVVATDTGGPREVLADGEAGILVPPGDSDVLATAIRSFFADSDRRAALADAAGRRAKREYVVPRMCSDVRDIIDRVAARKPRRLGQRRSLESRPGLST
jgi:glycosyltransferase involved in cell wall biosynthesis